MTIKPKTKNNDIQFKIDEISDLGMFVSSHDPRVLDINAEIASLHLVDRQAALRLQALMRHLTGDLDGALSVLDKVDLYDPQLELVLYSNFNRCDRAQAIFAKYCGPRNGNFISTAYFASVNGAFHKAAEFAHEALSMQLTELESLPLEQIFMIDKILTEFGVSDAQVGAILEVAGEVLQEHRLLFVGNGPEVEAFDIPGELRAVHMTYRLAVTASEAVSIYLEFIEKLFHRDMELPKGFHVSFGSF